MRLLLLSNSKNPGGGFLEHAEETLRDFLDRECEEILFVPFAVVTVDHDELTAAVAGSFARMGLRVRSVHRDPHAVASLRAAHAIAVSGGNTFALLAALYEHGLLTPIRERVREGIPYVGWSAGSNIVCPTIRTTNDMPIVQPPSFDALGLVPFQINPHFTDATIPNHGGETRSQRIEEFLVRNQEATVIGLPEGTMLRIEGDVLMLVGDKAATVFRHAQDPEEIQPGVVPPNIVPRT